jgi:N-acetylmuramic acid 6-phosphate etherase
MVDMVATNEKLTDRAKRIVMAATDCDEETASRLLEKSGYNVKIAVTAILTGKSADDAKTLLEKNGGYVSKAINEMR